MGRDGGSIMTRRMIIKITGEVVGEIEGIAIDLDNIELDEVSEEQ